MAMYQNMLVVIDPNQDDQPALRRAVYLHQRIGGKIKAFLPIYDFSYEMTTLLSPDERTAMRQGVISQRTAWIHEQAKYYLNAGVPIEIKVVWHNRPFEAIIQEVISGGHDLVLKMAHQHDRLEAVIFTPTDWHLLRKCPSPVWMVKDQPWPEGGKALVAVDLASEEPYHNANPTCMNGCPVGINIPKFIKNIERGEFLEAAKTLKATSALPAVCGRVCPQEKQCESQCTHLKAGAQTMEEADRTEETDETQAMLRQLYRMINRLGQLEKSIILLYLEEKSYEEIAEITGLTLTNVATKLSRIKDKLKKMNKEE